MQLQREYVTRHVETGKTKQLTTAGDSRRSKSNKYFLTLNNQKILVCKTFFQNTLDISERTVRTAMLKITSTGTVELDKRGGRQSQNVINLDQRKNKLADGHINHFPFVESHYCRASSSKNYLHHELSFPRMYKMLLHENINIPKEVALFFNVQKCVFKEKFVFSHTQEGSVLSLHDLYQR